MITPIVYILCIAGMAIQANFIIIEHKKKYVPAVILKGSASVVFVLIGALGYAACLDNSFGKMVFIGLILGAVGDVLLNLRFVFEKIGQKIFLAGIAAFLAGHILYLFALVPRCETPYGCALFGIVLAAIILKNIFSTMEVKKAFVAFGVVYVSAVLIMTCMAFGALATEINTTNILYSIGAVCFAVSDIVLIYNTFGAEQTYGKRIANLSLYYIGQLLIATSLFFA